MNVFFSEFTAIIVLIFALLFMVFMFLLIKLWFEINRFKKIAKTCKEIELFKSHFFLNKLNEILDLSMKNEQYKGVFIYFYHEYHNIFTKELRKMLDLFAQNFENVQDSNNIIVETKEQSYVYQQFEAIKFKVEQFNMQLMAISSWEKFAMERINFLNLILEKLEEEIIKTKMVVKLDFKKIENLLQNRKKKNDQFNEIIYKGLEKKDFAVLQKLVKNTALFCEQTLMWLKIITLFRITLPEVHQKLIQSVEKTFRLDSVKIIRQINRSFQEGMKESYDAIVNLDNFKAQKYILFLMQEIQNYEDQVVNIDNLRKLFLEGLKNANQQFNYALNQFNKFNKFIENFDKSLFFRQYKSLEFRNFNNKITETRKLINELTIQEQEIEKIMFFYEHLKSVHKIFENLTDLFKIFNKMEIFFSTEKIRNENLFFSLFNISTVLAKSNNFYLKEIFTRDYQKAVKFFVALKSKQITNKNKEQNFVSEFSYLNDFVRDLKFNIENTVLFRKIAEGMLVQVNKYRFINDFFQNKVLNIEVLFVKHHYKTAIDQLIEITQNKIEPWMKLYT